MYVFMPFVNQEILIGGMVGGFVQWHKILDYNFAGESCCVDLHDPNLCCEVTLQGFRCTCVLLFLLTDLAVFGTEISAFEIF